MPSDLDTYNKKRNFKKTKEPKGVKSNKSTNQFVIQEHHASHLHYDFRLEIKGVLKSWAVPKGLPEEPGIRRLAVQVEDHPIDYINFEGIIPEGNYGAGEVKIWDKGKYTLEKKTEKEILFELYGERIKGKFALIHTNGKNWILFMRKER